MQAKPEAGKLVIGTVALLIAATSSILVVCTFYSLPFPVPLTHTHRYQKFCQHVYMLFAVTLLDVRFKLLSNEHGNVPATAKIWWEDN